MNQARAAELIYRRCFIPAIMQQLLPGAGWKRGVEFVVSTCRSLAHVAHPHQLARAPWSLRGEVCKAAVTLMHEALWLLRPAGIELCAALCTVESMIDKYLYQTVQALALSPLLTTSSDRL